MAKAKECFRNLDDALAAQGASPPTWAIPAKVEIMLGHFLEHVIGLNRTGGQARAMVVPGSIQQALQYFCAFRDYLTELKSPDQAIVAFFGEPEFEGEKVSEAKLNGFPPPPRPTSASITRRYSREGHLMRHVLRAAQFLHANRDTARIAVLVLEIPQCCCVCGAESLRARHYVRPRDYSRSHPNQQTNPPAPRSPAVAEGGITTSPDS